MTAVERYHIDESNCNGVLSRLYMERNRIGERIDLIISHGYDASEEERSFDKIRKEIEELCEWRRTHKCLLEGDPGFRYC